jgi:hypothetical protein
LSLDMVEKLYVRYSKQGLTVTYSKREGETYQPNHSKMAANNAKET